MAQEYSFNPLQMALKPLYERAKEEDDIFALNAEDKEAKGVKSFAECCEYILGEAYAYANDHRQGNFGLSGCDDSQIVSMIKHYYDEDGIEIRKVGKVATQVKVAAAKPVAPPKPKEPQMPSLFDLL